MRPPAQIVVPDLDNLDERAQGGEPVNASDIARLTRCIRRLTELIVSAGGGGLLSKDTCDG